MNRPKLWLAAAIVYAAINVGGAAYAFIRGEWMHGAGHVALLVVGAAYAAWRLTRRPPRDTALTNHIDRRLEHLQQSVEAMALEVGRVEAAQREAAKEVARRAQEDRAPGSQ